MAWSIEYTAAIYSVIIYTWWWPHVAKTFHKCIWRHGLSSVQTNKLWKCCIFKTVLIIYTFQIHDSATNIHHYLHIPCSKCLRCQTNNSLIKKYTRAFQTAFYPLQATSVIHTQTANPMKLHKNYITVFNNEWPLYVILLKEILLIFSNLIFHIRIHNINA
jgi:hypothetical protein